MTETLAHGYSSESAQREPSNEYQHDRVKMASCALDESSFSIGRVNHCPGLLDGQPETDITCQRDLQARVGPNGQDLSSSEKRSD